MTPRRLVRPTDTDVDVTETGTRADLVWDDEVPGLCVRVYGNGAKSFIFIYRRNDRQRFVRIGMTPTWSLEGARRWAKELRAAVDRGGDPESYNRERQKIKPVESFIRFIAEHLQQLPVRRDLTRDEARRIAASVPKPLDSTQARLVFKPAFPGHRRRATILLLRYRLRPLA
jgi:plasmid stabilization system protein ParE